MHKDPVCGMNVDERSGLKAEYRGMTFYFCSPVCKKKFESEPEKYLKAKA
jgi:YHS domain-containing protein